MPRSLSAQTCITWTARALATSLMGGRPSCAWELPVFNRVRAHVNAYHVWNLSSSVFSFAARYTLAVSWVKGGDQRHAVFS